MGVHSVHLLPADFGHGQLQAQMLRHLHGVVDVLQVDGDAGAGGEVTAEQLGHLYVHDRALGKAALDGVKQRVGIQTGLGGKGKCLAHGQQVDVHFGKQDLRKGQQAARL